jgi:phosphonate metabolism protein (transferase hexapeptide repeat family)
MALAPNADTNKFGQSILGRMKQLSETPTIHPTAHIEKSHLGAWTEVGEKCQIVESTLDDYSYIGEWGNMIYTTVGKFCSIAAFVRLNPGNHPTQRPTSHHLTYRPVMYGFANEDEASFFQWRRSHSVTVGHDVWIGHGAVVLPGVSVGNGAVVTKDVAPYTIVVGTPAKVIRQRFDDAVIEKLEALQWWHWPREKLEARFEDFRNIDMFLEKYSEKA